MKILVPADGSPYTKRMLAYLVAHDEWLGHRHQYTVFTVVPALPHRAAAFAEAAVVRGYYDDDAEAVIRPIRTFFGQQGIDAEFIHRIGDPAHEISKLARDGKFDLILMGSQGHGAFANLVLGSVSSKVLAQCATPVLLVR